MDRVGLEPCDIFLFGGACACVLVDGAGSRLLGAVWRPVVGFADASGFSAIFEQLFLALRY